MKASPSNVYSDPIIRSMDFTETFHQEDTIALTEEEKKEAEQLQKDEQLRRSDPAAYNELIAKRGRWTNAVTSPTNTLQAFNPAFDSLGQGFPHFNPALYSTEQESHFLSLAAMTAGQNFPYLDHAGIPPLPESPFNDVSAATSPGQPPLVLPGTQPVPLGLSTRWNSAPPLLANDSAVEINKQVAPPHADGNELGASTESYRNRTLLSPILGASTTMIPRGSTSPEKECDSATLNLQLQADAMSASEKVSVATADQAVLSPVRGPNTTVRPLETSDDSEAYNLKQKGSRVTSPSSTLEPVLDLNPYPPLVDLLSREAARMSKERPSQKPSSFFSQSIP